MGLLDKYYDENFWSIHRQIKRYKSFYLQLIPFEDVAQEIFLAIISKPNDSLKEASHNINRLIKDYGYNVTLKSKDAFDASVLYEDSNRQEYWEYVENKYNEILNLYKVQSAKWILSHYNVPQTPYALASIARLVGGKRKYKKKNKTPFNKELAEKIMTKHKVDRHAFRQWKYNNYIPDKYLSQLEEKELKNP